MTAAGPGEFVVTTSNGQVAWWKPADGETMMLAGLAAPGPAPRLGEHTREIMNELDDLPST